MSLTVRFVGTVPYWRGAQWSLTSAGLETVNRPYRYDLEKERMGELTEDGRSFRFLLHIARKPWVDPDELCHAWKQAMYVYSEFFDEIPDGWERAYFIEVNAIRLSREIHERARKYLPDPHAYNVSEFAAAEQRAREELTAMRI